MLQTIEDSIIEIRGIPAILDSDVAALYEVETRSINQAVKNNPDKFPSGYILSLTKEELANLKSKILISSSPTPRWSAKGCNRAEICRGCS